MCFVQNHGWGTHWEITNKGFPEGELGRIAVNVSSVDPNIVYALVESKKSALYRSEDKGASWKSVNKTTTMGSRPFYFSNIITDPVDTNRVYKPGFYLGYSDNGGKNFRPTYVTGGRVHGDLHALWVSEKDNNLLYLGTDGGSLCFKRQGQFLAVFPQPARFTILPCLG